VESTAICEYIEEAYSKIPTLPEDLMIRAKIRGIIILNKLINFLRFLLNFELRALTNDHYSISK